MYASDDVGGYQAVTNTLTGISASANGSVDCAGLTTDQNGHVTTADELTTDQANLGSLGHGVSRFNCRHQAARFDHSQCDTRYISHLSYSQALVKSVGDIRTPTLRKSALGFHGFRQDVFYFGMDTRDDVRSNQTVTNALTRIGTSANGGVDRTGLTTDQNGHVTTTDELTTDQANLGSLGHGVSRFDRRHEAARFNHSQCDTGYISHLVSPLERLV